MILDKWHFIPLRTFYNGLDWCLEVKRLCVLMRFSSVFAFQGIICLGVDFQANKAMGSVRNQPRELVRKNQQDQRKIQPQFQKVAGARLGASR